MNEELFEKGVNITNKNLFELRSVKLVSDGALGSRGAALIENYSDYETKGILILDRNKLKKSFELWNKKILIVGDILHSRVALSNIYTYQKLGAEVTVCGPKSLIPKYIESLNVKVETDLLKALKWCDAVNMLRIQNERMSESFFPSVREYVQQFGLNKEILVSLDKEIIIMHPGPINRGVEITSEVADSDQAIILDQVENGVAIRMAIMYLLASKIY